MALGLVGLLGSVVGGYPDFQNRLRMRKFRFFQALLGPPIVPFLTHFFFGWEGSPTKIDKTERSWYPYSNLSIGGSRLLGSFVLHLGWCGVQVPSLLLGFDGKGSRCQLVQVPLTLGVAFLTLKDGSGGHGFPSSQSTLEL